MCTSHAIKLINIPSREVLEKPTFRKNVSRKTVRFSSKIWFFYYWISRIFLENSSLYAWQDNTYNVSTWKKIISEKTKKKFFHDFFIILHISQNPILGVKNKFSPFFSAISSPIGLKIFLVILQLIWGACFFFFTDTSYQSNMAGSAKILASWKTRFLARSSVFSFSWREF